MNHSEKKVKPKGTRSPKKTKPIKRRNGKKTETLEQVIAFAKNKIDRFAPGALERVEKILRDDFNRIAAQYRLHGLSPEVLKIAKNRMKSLPRRMKT